MHNKNQTKELTIGLSLPASHPKLEGIPPVMYTKNKIMCLPSPLTLPPHLSRITQSTFVTDKKKKKKKSRSLCLPSCAKGLHCPIPEV